MTPRFSLQPVLDYRHTRVEMLEVELGQLLANRQQNITFLEMLDKHRLRLYEDLSLQQKGEIDFLAVNQMRGNLKLVEDRMRQVRFALQELEQKVNSKQVEVVGAKQEEEMLVSLKNKEVERFRTQQALQENRLQDDIYIAQAHRRSVRPDG